MLLKFLRPETQFTSVDELQAQMTKDQEAAREYHRSRQIPVRFEGYV